MESAMTGVLLLNLGGPDSLAAVRPFLYNLFSDRDIIKLGPPFLQTPLACLISALRAKKVMAAYGLIGGKSPLLEITRAQAEALEHFLNKERSPATDHGLLKVYVGMRYWHPLIEETVGCMHREGIKKAIVLSLYPHYSIATTGSSLKRFKESILNYPLKYVCVESWCREPLYIDALVQRIQEGMKQFAEKPVVLFSAHSLPQKFIDDGDPYVKEIQCTIDEIVRRINIEWRLSYQSKTGPVKWLEPSTEHMLQEMGSKGIKNILVVPISFVSDHIETLYEIDMLYRDLAKGLGINLMRIESLNTYPQFIAALAGIVRPNLQKLAEGSR
jgi:ferrochelatase